MSKKDRTKGNLKPAKSDNAAALLGDGAHAFVGFDSQPSFVLIPEVQSQLKKLSKKDSSTKVKGLNDLNVLLPQQGDETFRSVLPQWCRFYPKLCQDDDTTVRRQTQILHRLIVENTKKDFVPYMKSVMGYWALSMFDPYSAAAKETKSAMFSIFPDEKWKNAMTLCKDEIVALLSDNLSLEVASLEEDSEDAQRKYNRIASQSLGLINFILSSHLQLREFLKHSLVPQLMKNPSFMKLIESPDSVIQRNVILLLEQLTSSDLVDVLDIEPVNIINLKTLENFALNDPDQAMVKKSWEVLRRLERTKFFTRSSKHERQWFLKLSNAPCAKPPVNIVRVSNYVMCSDSFDSKTEWLENLMTAFSAALTDAEVKVANLDALLQAVFLWLESPISTKTLEFVSNSLNQIMDHPKPIFFDTCFFVQVHEWSSKNKELKSQCESYLRSLFEGLNEREEILSVLLKFLKPRSIQKRVMIADSSEDKSHCADFGGFDGVYFEHLKDIKGLELSSKERLLFVSEVLLRYVNTNSGFRVEPELLAKMLNASVRFGFSEASAIAMFSVRSNYSLEDYEALCRLTEAGVLKFVIESDLKTQEKVLFRSESLYHIVKDREETEVMQLIAWNSCELKDFLVLRYLQYFKNTFEYLEDANNFVEFASICLKSLPVERNCIREKVFSISLSFDGISKTGVLNVETLLNAYLNSSLDFEQKMSAFSTIESSETWRSFGSSELSALIKRFANALEPDESFNFFSMLHRSFSSRIMTSLKSCISSLSGALVFNGIFFPSEQFGSTDRKSIDIGSVLDFIAEVRKNHHVLIQVEAPPELKLSDWVDVCEILTNHILPFRSETVELDITTSIRFQELFEKFSSTSFFSSCEGLITEDNRKSSAMELKYSTLTSTDINGIGILRSNSIDLALKLYCATLNLATKAAEFDEVLAHVLNEVSENDNLLCDGEDLNVYSTDVQILNRQIMLSSLSLFDLEEVDTERLRPLWDNILCSMVCFGKSLQATQSVCDNLLHLSFAQSFIDCFHVLQTKAPTIGDEGLQNEWNEVFRDELAKSACYLCLKFIKNDIPDVFQSRNSAELNSLKQIDRTLLKETIGLFNSKTGCVSFLSPGLLSQNYNVQFMTLFVLEKIVSGADQFLLDWAKTLLSVALLSSVDCEAMCKISDLEGSDKFEISDAETHAAITAFLMSHKLILTLFDKLKYAEINEYLERDLSDINLDVFFSFLFRIIDTDINPIVNLTRFAFYDSVKPSRAQSFVSNLAVDCFSTALCYVPSLCRNWFEKLDRRRRETVDQFTTRFLSPLIMKRAFDDVNSDKDMNKDERLAIKIFPSQNTVQAQYSIEDFAIDVKLSFAKNYPLGRISIEEIKKKKIGIKDEEWQRLLLDLKISLEQESSSLVSGIVGWKCTLEKIFSGVEECCVCMAVLHPSNRSMPSKPCKVCKKKFHAVCLFTWFEKGTANCPYCRSVF